MSWGSGMKIDFKIKVFFSMFFICLMLVLFFPGKAYVEKLIYFSVVLVVFFLFGLLIRNITSDVKRDLLLLGLILFILYCPLIVKGYFFHDDYWAFIEGYARGGIGIRLGLVYQRLIQGAAVSVFSFITHKTIWILRVVVLLFFLVFISLLYLWVYECSSNRKYSIIFSLLIGVSSITTDCLAYGAISTFFISLDCFFISFILIYKTISDTERKLNRKWMYLIAALLMIFGYNAYQLGMPIYISLIGIHVLFAKDENRSVKLFVRTTALLVISGLIYMLINYTLHMILLVPTSDRSAFCNSIGEVVQKLSWFFSEILPMAFYRIEVAVLGRHFTNLKNYWSIIYNINWDFLSVLVFIVLIVFVLFGIVMYARNEKRPLSVLFLFISIPASYMVCMLLKESSYMTYYAYPLFVLLLSLVLNGAIYLKCLLKNETVFGIGLALVLLCIGVQNSFYLNNYWIGENSLVYDTIKNGITNIDNKRIHVYGALIPGAPSIYTTYAVKDAIEEKGEDSSQYFISISDNEYIASTISEEDANRGFECLDEIEKQQFLDLYVFDSTYKVWSMSNSVDWSNWDEIIKCQKILLKMKILPDDMKDNIINLQWVTHVWH